jgi:alanine racemase
VIAGPRARVHLEALRHNLRVAREAAPNARVIAVVKANAYGHGLVPVAAALRQADALAVARLGEAVALRDAGVDSRLIVLEGPFSAEELALAARHRLDIVVHSVWQIELLEAWQGPPGFEVWVKMDTGMNRLGFRIEQFAAARARLERSGAVQFPLRLMTHLAVADDPQATGTTRLQIERFRELADGLGLECSVANSAGVLATRESHFDWVRPGIMLYGISPFAQRPARDFGLMPAMALETSIIAVRSVHAGEAVGYGSTWVARRDSSVAIAAVGYADGYPRHLGNGTPVWLLQGEALLAGRVSMDMIAIDVTHCDRVEVGETVQLWGDRLPVERIATLAGTIPYELVCGISQRVAVTWA